MSAPPDRFLNRFARVTTVRESVPANPTNYIVTQVTTTTEITGLRIVFRVERGLRNSPDNADVTITNLATNSRADFETKPLQVQLEAGYIGKVRQLFAGDLRFGMTKTQGPSFETLLQLGEDDCHYRFSRVNRSYGAGTTYRQMLVDCASSVGMTLPTNLALNPSLDRQITRGDVAIGAVRDRVTQLLKPFGYQWTFQNGVIVALQDDEVLVGDAVPIDEDHGMIGSPYFGSPPQSGKPPHMLVKCLLYPELRPGMLVQLTSKTKNGRFRIEKLVHEGDTHGRSWDTEIELKPLNQ